jgi:hypothetical protein
MCGTHVLTVPRSSVSGLLLCRCIWLLSGQCAHFPSLIIVVFAFRALVDFNSLWCLSVGCGFFSYVYFGSILVAAGLWARVPSMLLAVFASCTLVNRNSPVAAAAVPAGDCVFAASARIHCRSALGRVAG